MTIFSLSLVFWRLRLYWNIKSETGNSEHLTSRNKLFFSVNVCAFKGSFVRKWKWVSSMSNIVCCSAVRTHYTRATRQSTRAPLPYIHSNVTKNVEKTYSILEHKPLYYGIHTQFVIWRYLFYNQHINRRQVSWRILRIPAVRYCWWRDQVF